MPLKIEPIKSIAESKVKKKSAAKTEEGLNLKQEEFCQMFTSPDINFFGNGVQCYLEIYDIDRSKPNWYKTACVAASTLLSNIKVCERISSLLEIGGFNDQNVDKQHLFLINQFSDYKSKVAAIKEYNALKSRVKTNLQIGLTIEDLMTKNKEARIKDKDDDNNSRD